MGSTANPAVIDRVKGLLNEPGGSSSFTRAGFSPGQLGYTTPSLSCPLLRRAQRLGASAVAAEIAITSPAPGTSVTAGESLHVEVTGDQVAEIVERVNDGRRATRVRQPDRGANVSDVLRRPLEQNVVVAGIDAEGRLVAVSDTLTVDVTVPAALSNITIYPRSPTCSRADSDARVTGHYDDRVARDLSSQPGLSMTFATGTPRQTAPAASC
jgi:hypothetical protein